jgi:hypothetical protein
MDNQILGIELSSKLQDLIDKVKSTLANNKSVAVTQAW